MSQDRISETKENPFRIILKFILGGLSNHKVGCVFPMVIIPILPQAEFGPNDHKEEASTLKSIT